jgi:hypothetical protein
MFGVQAVANACRQFLPFDGWRPHQDSPAERSDGWRLQFQWDSPTERSDGWRLQFQWDSVPLARAESSRRKREDRWGQPTPKGRWRPHRDSNPGFSLERAAS